MTWTPMSWRRFPARHQPRYADEPLLEATLASIAALPPLVRPHEIDRLRTELASAWEGRAFVLQAGDCAETLDDSPAAKVAGLARVLVEMTRVLGRPVVKIGRIAGQFAKPRSPTSGTPFLGESVNGVAADHREPDPRRLLQAHLHAAASHEALRSRQGGTIYTSHEGLLLRLEERHTRFDAERGAWYNESAHMLWIGERTRDLDGAHVEYFRGIANPIGLKVGPEADPGEIVRVARALDPSNTPGKVALIPRLGARHATRLAALHDAVRQARLRVLWLSDPMHGNTRLLATGHKTRDLGDVLAELHAAAAQLGRDLAGVHLELTSEEVTECTGGTPRVTDADVPRRYLSRCDPRLSGSQALDVALFLSRVIENESREHPLRTASP